MVRRFYNSPKMIYCTTPWAPLVCLDKQINLDKVIKKYGLELQLYYQKQQSETAYLCRAENSLHTMNEQSHWIHPSIFLIYLISHQK